MRIIVIYISNNLFSHTQRVLLNETARTLTKVRDSAMIDRTRTRARLHFLMCKYKKGKKNIPAILIEFNEGIQHFEPLRAP